MNTMNNFLKMLQDKSHILADGATGTNLFGMGLETGDPPEPWNIDHKDRIRSLHQGFVDAGSDLFLTNSFGGTSYRLKLHNLEKRVFELNKAAGVIAREVADQADRLVIVAGSMGPTGEMIEPHGLMTPREATDAFRAQAEGLAEGGADVLWLETMYAMEELEAAMEAVKDIGLPVCATMSFDTAGKTMMGITPSNLAKRSQDLNLSGFGANCGIGAPDLLATINVISKNVNSKIIECVGPEIITFRQIIEKLLILIGKKRMLIPFPLKGSGFLNERIFAAAAPNFSLLMLVNLIKFCFGHSIFTSVGISKLIS